MDELTQADAQARGHIENGDAKYFPYTSEFTNEEGDVRFTFHFRRPQRTHMVQIAKAGNAKTFDVTGEVLAQLVLPDEVTALRKAMSDWPALIPAFVDEVMKRAGMGSVFAGK